MCYSPGMEALLAILRVFDVLTVLSGVARLAEDAAQPSYRQPPAHVAPAKPCERSEERQSERSQPSC